MYVTRKGRTTSTRIVVYEAVSIEESELADSTVVAFIVQRLTDECRMRMKPCLGW